MVDQTSLRVYNLLKEVRHGYREERSYFHDRG